MPPVSSKLEPRYLKWCTLCSSSPKILTGSLPWPLSSPNLKSMNWVLGLLILIPLSSNALLQVSKYSVMSVSSSPHSTMSSANIIDPGTSFLTIQYNTIQYNTIQYNTIQYNTIQYNTMQCNAMQCNAMQCNAMQCNAMQCNAMQCNATQRNTI